MPIIQGEDIQPLVEQGVVLRAHEALRIALERQKMSQAELSRRVGCSRTHIGQVLIGTRDMTLTLFESIADALGYEVRIELKKKTSP